MVPQRTATRKHSGSFNACYFAYGICSRRMIQLVHGRERPTRLCAFQRAKYVAIKVRESKWCTSVAITTLNKPHEASTISQTQHKIPDSVKGFITQHIGINWYTCAPGYRVLSQAAVKPLRGERADAATKCEFRWGPPKQPPLALYLPSHKKRAETNRVRSSLTMRCSPYVDISSTANGIGSLRQAVSSMTYYSPFGKFGTGCSAFPRK